MPICKGTTNIGGVFKGTTEIDSVYKGTVLVYENGVIQEVSGVPPLTLPDSLPRNMLGYKVYGKSSQTGTPTPSDSIDIESVGDKTYNLWEPSGTNYGWIRVDGTRTTSEGVSRRIAVEVGKTYNYVSTNEEDGHFYNCIAQYDENMNFISGTRSNITNSQKTKTNSVTITNSSTKYLVCAYYTTSPYIAPATNMITEGATVPDYKPYGYELPIVVSGINVFNKDAAELTGCTLSGTTFTSNSATSNIDIKIPAGRYTLTCTNNQQVFLRNGKVTSGTIGSKTSSADSVTFDFTGSVDGYLRMTFFGGTVKNIQIEKGSSYNAYEPYYVPTTTNIYLSKPLNKIGTYTDYLDFESQKIIRNTNWVLFKGNEAFSTTSLTVTGYFTCTQNRSDRSSEYTSSLCTHFKYGTGSGNYIFFSGSNNNFFYFRISESYGVNSLTTFRAWITKQYTDGNPVIVVYPRAASVEESFVSPSIRLHDGTNIISIGTTTTPSNAWVKYKAKP